MDLNLTIILGLYLITILFGYTMKFINLRHLKQHGATIPPEFEGHIDGDLLKKTRDYTLEHSRFGYITSIFDAHKWNTRNHEYQTEKYFDISGKPISVEDLYAKISLRCKQAKKL